MALSRDNLDQTLPATRTIAEPVRYVEKPTNPQFIDIEGQRFSRLVVLGYLGLNNWARTMWHCRCDCGEYCSPTSNNLRQGKTASCGCYAKEMQSSARRKHGGTVGGESPEYSTYMSAKRRCQNPKDQSYHKYGLRGIEFEFSSFEDFLKELGPRPSKKHSVDRIINDKGYAPGNVRWATSKEQGRNRRGNKHITINGITRLQCEWAEKMGMSDSLIANRLLYMGWCPECAVTIPPKGGLCPHRTVTPG